MECQHVVFVCLPVTCHHQLLLFQQPLVALLLLQMLICYKFKMLAYSLMVLLLLLLPLPLLPQLLSLVSSLEHAFEHVPMAAAWCAQLSFETHPVTQAQTVGLVSQCRSAANIKHSVTQLPYSNGHVFAHQALSRAAVAASVTEVGNVSQGVAQGILIQAAFTW